jgi:hypothetical protein
VCEKEREREWAGRQTKSERAQVSIARDVCGERESVCVCVCVLILRLQINFTYM